jgi:osmotically-inducible protein OsmY
VPDAGKERIAMKTDREIQEQVIAALQWESGIHIAYIDVSVSNGVVTLHGFVTSLREKHLAEQVTQRVYPVCAIANEIVVTPDGAFKRSDPGIAEAANALEWDSAIPDDAIKATVRKGKGWVTLTGTVGWQYQNAAAERAVRNLNGIEGISNAIVVEPSPQNRYRTGLQAKAPNWMRNTCRCRRTTEPLC